MSFVRLKHHSSATKHYRAVMSDFGGGVRLGSRYECGSNSFPILENMLMDDGVLSTRKGQYCVSETAYGNCNGAVRYEDGVLLHLGTKLYFWDGTAEPQELYTLADRKSIMFVFGARAYVMDGSRYVYYDGETVSPVAPYIPIIMTGRNHEGGGETYEAFNLIGRGFTVWFNCENNYIYKLPFSDLADDAVTVTLNGTDISSSCTVNRADGTVRLPNHSEELGINNLHITAYLKAETIREGLDKIYGCTFAENYGGNEGNGTRMFFSGNENYPTHYFRSGLLDPTYFPDMDFELVGFENDRITALKKQYDELIVFCKNSVHGVKYINSDSGVIFSSRTINSKTGCDMPDSIQLINNNLVFGNSERGIYMISSTVYENENNVVPISKNVNPTADGLLSRNNIKSAYSADYNGKYWLMCDGRCYIWDYGRTPYANRQDRLCWYTFTDFNCNMPFELGGKLYFFNGGKLCGYGGDSDYSEPIVSRIVSSPSGLGYDRAVKKLTNIFIIYRGKNNTRATVNFFCDDKYEDAEPDGSIVLRTATFSWNSFEWNMFSFLSRIVTRYFKSGVMIPRANSYTLEIISDKGGFRLERIELEYTAQKGI